MKKTTLSIILIFSFFMDSKIINAQQDAQYTQYVYNTLTINPAYAGSREALSFVALYRSQWVGLEGAPRSLSFSGHTPLNNKVGVGLNITRDEIFITDETFVDGIFSYTLDLGEVDKLAFGLKAGAQLLNIDANRLNTFDNESLQVLNVDNRFAPQIGLGAFYYTNRFYLGFSAPNLLETEYFDTSENQNGPVTSIATDRVNFYAISGYTFDISHNLKLKPATLVRAVRGAPFQVDLTLNALINERFILGAAYRWSAAFSGLVGFQLSDQFLLGLAYDRETTALQQFNDGSFEFFLRFEFLKNRKRLLSPRFF